MEGPLVYHSAAYVFADEKVVTVPSSRCIMRIVGIVMLLSLSLRFAQGSSDFKSASSNNGQAGASKQVEVLWYRRPAPIWDEALPVGNGRLGAMVFGGANTGANNGDLQASAKNANLMDGSQTSGADEHLQLNESSLWQGARANRLNPGAHEAVPQIRSLLLESKGLMAQKSPPRKSSPSRT